MADLYHDKFYDKIYHGMAEKLEAFLAGYRREIAEEAGRLADAEMPGLSEELFGLFEKTGNRLRYEEVYFTRRKFLAVFGLLALLQQKQGEISKACLEKLARIMEETCREECWALPAHVNRAEAGWRTTVDLFACETAQTLAELTDRLGDALPAGVREAAAENVRRRVLQPFFSVPAPYSGWEGSDNNWNAVCAGAIGSACLHLMRENGQRLEQCLDRICKSLTAYVDGFAEDGTCLEGMGYYTYGMTYFVNFADELYACTGGRRDLLRGKWGGFEAGGNDRRLRIAQFPAKCFFGDGRSVSFSDGDSRDAYRVGICCALAMRFGAAETIFPGGDRAAAGLPEATVAEMAGAAALPGAALQNAPASSGMSTLPDAPALQNVAMLQNAASLHLDPCYRFAALKMDLEQTERYLERIKEAQGMGEQERTQAQGMGERAQDAGRAGSGPAVSPAAVSGSRFHILPAAQWCIGTAASGVGFACKGGHNGEPHNHNDIGHFIYEAGGEILFADLGAGEYTKEYFGAGRYDILCNRSRGHSVPVIDGQEQCAGSGYRCCDFQAQADGSVRMELSGAYPKGLLQRFERIFRFDLGSGRLAVQDNICFPEEETASRDSRETLNFRDAGEVRAAQASWEILENLVTQIRPRVFGSGIVLEAGGVRAALSIEGTEPSGVRILEYDHSNHQGRSEKVYALQWQVPAVDGKAACTFCITIF